MLKNIGHLLSEEIQNSYSMFDHLRSTQDEWRYRFLTEKQFTSLPGLSENARSYWLEMLQRIHVIVLVSSFKMLRWFDSADNSFSNYYGFCASLRGLIESCADAFFTLRQVPLTVASDYRVIFEQINGNSRVITNHQLLEESLLHYLQATRLSAQERRTLPGYLAAKHITEYIKEIDGGDGDVLDLYGRLCGIAHPSSESTQTLLFEFKGETIVCCDSEDLERKLVETILEAKSETITKIFRIYVANVVSTILLVNRFQIPSLQLGVSFEDDFLKTPIWAEIQNKIDLSELRYSNAIVSGKYE